MRNYVENYINNNNQIDFIELKNILKDKFGIEVANEVILSLKNKELDTLTDKQIRCVYEYLESISPEAVRKELLHYKLEMEHYKVELSTHKSQSFIPAITNVSDEDINELVGKFYKDKTNQIGEARIIEVDGKLIIIKSYYTLEGDDTNGYAN